MKESLLQRMMEHPPADWGCFSEGYLCLGFARLAILLVPFRRICRFLGVPNQESSKGENPAFQVQLRRIGWALDAAARRTPWQSSCLARALAGRAMLHRRGIPSTLYLGVTPGSADRRALNAHAWLRSGILLVTGGQEQEDFTAVACFGDRPRESEETP